MSRSRKKAPVYKDPSNHSGKRQANRKFRRKVKENIFHEKEIPVIDEVLNYYSIVDFKTNGFKEKYSEEEVERLTRK